MGTTSLKDDIVVQLRRDAQAAEALGFETLVSVTPKMARQLAEEVDRLRAANSRMSSWLLGDCDCPCCEGTQACAADCTFAADCEDEAKRMHGARAALFGHATDTVSAIPSGSCRNKLTLPPLHQQTTQSSAGQDRRKPICLMAS